MHPKGALETLAPLKIGFIGGGINSAVGNTHRIACQMDNRWKLVCGCFSRDADINSKSAEAWGISSDRRYESWENLLTTEAGNIDAVCVLTPIPTHAEVAISALNRGFAVVCEKTLAATSESADAICAAAAANKAFLAVTYNYTAYPMIRELRSMILQGSLGKVNILQLEMPQEGYARVTKEGKLPQPQAWRLKDGPIPVISLDLGAHLQQMASFLTGEELLKVVADQASYGHFSAVQDSVMCIARYSGSLRGQIWYGKVALGNRNGLRVRVYGTKGSAEWFQMRPEELLFANVDGDIRMLDRASNVGLADQQRYNRFKAGHPAGFIEAFANLYSDIADGIVEFRQTGACSSPWVVSGQQAARGLRALEAITRSAMLESWQHVA